MAAMLTTSAFVGKRVAATKTVRFDPSPRAAPRAIADDFDAGSLPFPQPRVSISGSSPAAGPGAPATDPRVPSARGLALRPFPTQRRA